MLIVKIFNFFAISRTTGIIPLPVDPPSPEIKNRIFVPKSNSWNWFSHWNATLSACSLLHSLTPVSKNIFFSAWLNPEFSLSVSIVIYSTFFTPEAIIKLTKFIPIPPIPITFIFILSFIPLSCSCKYKLYANLPSIKDF